MSSIFLRDFPRPRDQSSFDFVAGSTSRKVTILLRFLALGTVAVEMQ